MESNLKLSDSLTKVGGIGPTLNRAFESLGIENIGDLIYYAPRRYDDYSNLLQVKNFKPGLISARLRINNIKSRYVRRGLHITEALGSDETGTVRLVWFNQPYRSKNIKPDVEYYVSGKFGLTSGRLSIISPSLELESEFPISTNGILPIYKTNKNISVTQIRRAIKAVYSYKFSLNDYIPQSIISQQNLININLALRNLHFPKSFSDLESSRRRLSFDEIFALSLVSLKNRSQLKKDHGYKVKTDVELAKKFINRLPFKLTDSQRKVIWQIYLDLAKEVPMNRLLEGDVGSGKTVVALMCALMVMNNDWQVVFIAPTEVLAKQHFRVIVDLLRSLKLESKV